MKTHGSARSLTRRLLAGALALPLLAGSALATWSIVVVNTKTGEVAVGTATCLTNTDINRAVPVIVPGFGAGASQSSIDLTGLLRKTIRRSLLEGNTPDQVLADLFSVNGLKQRQIGVAALVGTPITHTGTFVGKAKGGVVGVVGDLRYAIQGNVLTGEEVWLAAEDALINAPGDLSQKLMASMEAARAMGGDGRCSCSQNDPTSCGAPPAGGFTKSAHTGWVGVARIGDELGICNSTFGCAAGRYFLDLNVSGGQPDPDPVFVLQDLYDAWRLGQVGRPDQVLSQVESSVQCLVADGATSTTVTIRLADIEGTPLTSGGLDVNAWVLSEDPAVTTRTPVVDHGDGTYSFQVVAGLSAGTDVWRVSVADAAGEVVLQPDVVVPVDPASAFHVGQKTVSASAGAVVPITVNFGPFAAGAPYVILGSASGTSPGTTFQGFPVALNPDKLYVVSIEDAAPPLFDQTQGVLDTNGRAQGFFLPGAGKLTPLVGSDLHWSAVVFAGANTFVADPIAFTVVP